MKYLQIIVLCEGESDAIYLDMIFKMLKEKNPDINFKFTSIPIKGKTNFRDEKYIDKVEKTKLKFQGESQVLYVVDTDDVDTSKEDLELLEKITIQKSEINFIIGGSNGVDDELRKLVDFRLAFSSFTFPHQLMRLILMEQIYRWISITKNIKYHK